MAKQSAIIEITSDSLKLLIGYEENGKPVTLYTKELSTVGMISNGAITDPESLIATLKSLHHIQDPIAKLEITINDICLILPPLGLAIYQTRRGTNTVNAPGPIVETDIRNVVGMVKGEKVQDGYEVVDIIPEEFIIDGEHHYAVPPLGQNARYLDIVALIHTLPKGYVDSYLGVLADAGFSVRRTSVSSFAAGRALLSEEAVPQQCILFDIGARLSTLSLIGQGKVFYAETFLSAGDDLTEYIASALNIPAHIAEELKRRYGYDTRTRTYRANLAADYPDIEQEITQKELNDAIEKFFESSFSVLLKNAMDKLFTNGAGIDALPIVLTGGTSLLRGLVPLMQNLLPSHDFFLYKPTSIGARDPRYMNLLGFVLIAGHYSGSLSDATASESGLSRTKSTKNKKGNRSNQSSD